MKYLPSKHGVSQSQLAAFLACPQRARLRLLGWELMAKRFALDFGTLWHALLEAHYGGKSPKAAALKWKKELPKTTDPRDIDKAFGTVEALFPTYVKYWKKQDSRIEWVALENWFNVVWHKWPLRGRRDGVFRLKGRKGLWVVEHKTVTAFEADATMENKLALDFQAMFYCIATQEEAGERVAGVLYNFVRKPSLRLKATETPKEFAARLKEDVKKRKETYFKRYVVAYPPGMLREFAKDLKRQLTRFEEWCKRGYPGYKNLVSCLKPYPCFYLSACASGQLVGYRQNTRAPWLGKEDKHESQALKTIATFRSAAKKAEGAGQDLHALLDAAIRKGKDR